MGSVNYNDLSALLGIQHRPLYRDKSPAQAGLAESNFGEGGQGLALCPALCRRGRRDAPFNRPDVLTPLRGRLGSEGLVYDWRQCAHAPVTFSPWRASEVQAAQSEEAWRLRAPPGYSNAERTVGALGFVLSDPEARAAVRSPSPRPAPAHCQAETRERGFVGCTEPEEALRQTDGQIPGARGTRMPVWIARSLLWQGPRVARGAPCSVELKGCLCVGVRGSSSDVNRGSPIDVSRSGPIGSRQ